MVQADEQVINEEPPSLTKRFFVPQCGAQTVRTLGADDDDRYRATL